MQVMCRSRVPLFTDGETELDRDAQYAWYNLTKFKEEDQAFLSHTVWADLVHDVSWLGMKIWSREVD